MQKETRSWFMATLTILNIIGLLLSTYYIYHFQTVKYTFSPQSSFCSINELIDCDSLQFTSDAQLLGIPIGAFSFFFFSVFLLGLVWVRKTKNCWFFWGLRVWATLGFLGTLQKIAVSFLTYEKLCLTCAAGWIVFITLFGLVWLLKQPEDRQWPAPKPLFQFVGIVGLIGVFSILILPNVMMAPRQRDLIKSMKTYVANKFKEPQTEFNNGEIFVRHPDGDYALGSLDAPVRIVVFHDFECFYCRKMSKVLGEIHRNFETKVFVVLKNNPLDHHCNPSVNTPYHLKACYWAAATRCVGRVAGTNAFWHTYSRINSEPIEQKTIEHFVDKQVSATAINQCLKNKLEDVRVQTDIHQAVGLRLEGTPVFFINGYRFEGYVPYLFVENFVRRLLTARNQSEDHKP